MLDEVGGWLTPVAERWAAGGRNSAAVKSVLLAVAAVAAMVGATFVNISVLQVTVGGVAGAVLFAAAWLGWASALPDEWRDKLDWRGRWPLPRRRMAFLWGAIVWAAVAVFTAQFTGGPVMGGLTTAVVLCLWRQATATPEERAVLNEELDEALAVRLEEKAAAAAEKEEKGGASGRRRRFWRR